MVGKKIPEKNFRNSRVAGYGRFGYEWVKEPQKELYIFLFLCANVLSILTQDKIETTSVWFDTWAVLSSIPHDITKQHGFLVVFFFTPLLDKTGIHHQYDYLFGVIVRVRVVFRKTVVGDWCFDCLSGSHLQSQVKSQTSQTNNWYPWVQTIHHQ